MKQTSPQTTAKRTGFDLTSRDSARYRAAALRNGRNGGGSLPYHSQVRFFRHPCKGGDHAGINPSHADFSTKTSF